ncbi:MAG: hypothetical protein COB88_06120 [Flavobacteriales bacterium]|nr:MAG: hypothetical protein COB88_06120 [Flavobacteriales bacterium]
MKRIILIFLSTAYIGIWNTVIAQDIHFSQFSQTPLLINPALTGVLNGDMRAFLNYKDQWNSFGAPYKTYALSYEMAVLKQKWKNNYLGVGLSAFHDKAGNSDLSTTQVNLSISGNALLDEKHRVSVGLQGGFAQRSINYSELKWGSQFDGEQHDPSLSSRELYSSDTYVFGDFSTGILWSYGTGDSYISSNDQFRANAGLAFFHFNKPRQGFYADEELYAKLVFHGGMYIGFKNSNTALLPSILVMKQGAPIEANLGGMLRFRIKEEAKYTGLIKESAILFGCHYRVGDAIIPSFSFEWANYAIGINYDINVSELKVATAGRGGFEISVRYINPNPFTYGRGTGNKSML